METQPQEVLEEYGRWIASLAPWSHFVTLTHRLPDGRPGWSRVGRQRHNRLVREWFHGDVRKYDVGARWWSETELHLSGIPHEHGLLALGPAAPWLSIRQAWYERAGFAVVESIGDAAGVAAYVEKVAKYASKSAVAAPKVWGFGLLPRESFARVLAGAFGAGHTEAASAADVDARPSRVTLRSRRR